MKQNMGVLHRVLYVVTGVVLIALPFLVTLASPLHLLVPAAGLLALLSGGTGR